MRAQAPLKLVDITHLGPEVDRHPVPGHVLDAAAGDRRPYDRRVHIRQAWWAFRQSYLATDGTEIEFYTEGGEYRRAILGRDPVPDEPNAMVVSYQRIHAIAGSD